MQRLSSRSSALIVTVAVLLAACGGGGNGGTPPSTTGIAKTSANSGDAQSGTVGQPLANSIQVVVTENGSPSPGVTVTWSTATGGSLAPVSGPTGADGIASTEWTLGTTSGAQAASATLAGATGSPVTFTATATADAAATLAKVAGNNGDNQTGEINSQLPLPVQARVTDQFGNAVGGTGVNWSATGAAVSAATVASNASGLSEVTVTLGGTAGPITIVAASDGLTGSPLTFNATATEPLPTPASINVTVRNDNFLSVRNGTVNPAVDTVLAGGTVTWTWAPTANNPHSVTSTGSPSFPGRAVATQPPPYAFTFSTPGTYNYYCTEHGLPTSGMRGRIVVR